MNNRIKSGALDLMCPNCGIKMISIVDGMELFFKSITCIPCGRDIPMYELYAANRKTVKEYLSELKGAGSSGTFIEWEYKLRLEQVRKRFLSGNNQETDMPASPEVVSDKSRACL